VTCALVFASALFLAHECVRDERRTGVTADLFVSCPRVRER
jgi:hypothetical protein